ncbi:MAG: hypothetical protein JSU07_08705 [Bacteroidetes bacterium]|nr:hypothetical protein [Bacteroidota bacterium]
MTFPFNNKIIVLLFIALFANYTKSQCVFEPDTFYYARENKNEIANAISFNLKNGGKISLFKCDNGKFYLKIIVTENLYFDKIDKLEIISGEKSITFKDTKQYKNTKYSAFYIVEILRNYVATLKDDGLNSIVFGKIETKFTKSDSKNTKQIAACLYKEIENKKN